MKKNVEFKKLAVRQISLFNGVIVIIIYSVFMLLFPKIGIYDKPQPLYGLIIFISQLPIWAIITFISIKNGKVNEILNNWNDERARKRTEIKDKYYKSKLELGNSYPIISIFVELNSCYTFVIETMNIAKTATPIVVVNGTKCKIRIKGENKVLCYLPEQIRSNVKTLTFSSGNTVVIDNPFYLDSTKNGIRWQVEGHAEEKKIFIPKSVFPNAIEGPQYDLEILADNKIVSACWGKFDTKSDMVIVNIGYLFKESFSGKNCVLRPCFDKTVKLSLPKPEIFSVNYKPVLSNK